MPIETAERIYTLIQVLLAVSLLAMLFWLHRSFYDQALIDDPESLSDAHLRRILSWGKVIRRIQSGGPKGEDIELRMRLAMEELRRRRRAE